MLTYHIRFRVQGRRIRDVYFNTKKPVSTSWGPPKTCKSSRVNHVLREMQFNSTKTPQGSTLLSWTLVINDTPFEQIIGRKSKWNDMHHIRVHTFSLWRNYISSLWSKTFNKGDEVVGMVPLKFGCILIATIPYS